MAWDADHRTPGRRRRVGLLLGCALAAFLLATPAAPQSDRQEELEQIRGEIARLQSRLGRLQRDERTVSDKLERTRVELSLQEQRVAEARKAREVAEERISGLETRVAALEEELGRVRSDLKAQLVALYRLGRAGYVRLFLFLRPDDQLLPAIRQLRYLARRDGAAVERFLDTRARLGVEREELADARRRAEAWVGQEEARQGRLEELQGEQRRLLASVNAERRQLQSQTSELLDKERKLSNFLAFLYGQAQSPMAGAPMQDFRGVLDWPVQGRVKVGFGPRLDRRYKTRVPHNGISIATRTGDAVHCVFPGRVLFSAPFQGYGPTVIVNHPGRVFTLYAGLDGVRVRKGDVVSLGQVVGTATGELYFEIRVENRPEDPLHWLR